MSTHVFVSSRVVGVCSGIEPESNTYINRRLLRRARRRKRLSRAPLLAKSEEDSRTENLGRGVRRAAGRCVLKAYISAGSSSIRNGKIRRIQGKFRKGEMRRAEVGASPFARATRRPSPSRSTSSRGENTRCRGESIRVESALPRPKAMRRFHGGVPRCRPER